MTDTDLNELYGDDRTAAEFVLGVLGQDERREAVRRIEQDRGFATLVAYWEARLVPWAGETAPVAPPASLWPRIVSTLPKQRSAQRWGNLSFWRGLAIGTSALAAASIAALFVVLKTPSPPLVASLSGEGRVAFVATLDPARAAVAVVPAGFALASGRVAELWLIVPGGKPRSLGLLDSAAPVSLKIPADIVTQANSLAVLAVSLEPPGGSPTGAPTGPVIAQGKLANL